MKFGRYIVGLISGLTFGMLFAPKRGKKLRDEIFKKGAGSGHEALSVLFQAFRDAGADAAGEMKKLSENEQLQSALNMSKEKMRAYLSELEESGYDLAARAQEKVEAISTMATKTGSQFKKRAVKAKSDVKRAMKESTEKKPLTRKKKASGKKTSIKKVK